MPVAAPVPRKRNEKRVPQEPHENGHPTAAAGPGSTAAELAKKPYQKEVEEFIQITPVCQGDFDLKIILILDALQEKGRMDAALKHLYGVVHMLPRAKVNHWRGYLYKLLRDFDDEAYHSMKGQMAAKHAERLPWVHEPSDHQRLRPVAAEFVPGHLGWKGEMHPEDLAACARHKLHAEAQEFHPGDETYDPAAAGQQKLHADAPEFHPGDETYDPAASEQQKLHANAPEFHPGDSTWGMTHGSAKSRAEQKDPGEKSIMNQEAPLTGKAPLYDEKPPICVEAKV